MPRKKSAVKEAALSTAVSEAPTSESSPDVFDQAIAAQQAPVPPAQQPAIVHALSDGSHLPPAEREAAHENGHTARYAPPMTASGGPGTVRANGDGHAASVGRRDPVIQSGITYFRNDLLAGVRQGEGFRLVGGRKVREGIIAFAEKPSAEVIAAMKDAGFEWQAADKLWTHPISPESGWRDRAHTEETFEAVSKQIRSERGIEHSVGVGAA